MSHRTHKHRRGDKNPHVYRYIMKKSNPRKQCHQAILECRANSRGMRLGSLCGADRRRHTGTTRFLLVSISVTPVSSAAPAAPSASAATTTPASTSATPASATSAAVVEVLLLRLGFAGELCSGKFGLVVGSSVPESSLLVIYRLRSVVVVGRHKTSTHQTSSRRRNLSRRK